MKLFFTVFLIFNQAFLFAQTSKHETKEKECIRIFYENKSELKSRILPENEGIIIFKSGFKDSVYFYLTNKIYKKKYVVSDTIPPISLSSNTFFSFPKKGVKHFQLYFLGSEKKYTIKYNKKYNTVYIHRIGSCIVITFSNFLSEESYSCLSQAASPGFA